MIAEVVIGVHILEIKIWIVLIIPMIFAHVTQKIVNENLMSFNILNKLKVTYVWNKWACKIACVTL